jgi:hypothetical protein
LRPKRGRSEDIVVFWLQGRESHCDECGAELTRGDFLRREGERGLCLSCADFDHLEFLASGDAALTRRASKYSRLRAVVVKWSKARRRYERQGILVEPAAIERAEEECLADEDVREQRRLREAMRRERLDEEYVEAFAERVREHYPRCPPGTATRVAEHACRKYSGRIGRTAMAKAFDPEAVTLAVRAHVRHELTDYDEHLLGGTERREARELVASDVARILDDWS